MCQHAEEHSHPELVYNISGGVLRLGGDASLPLSGALQGSIRAGSGSPAMGLPSFSLHQSSAHPQSPEPRSGHAVEERDFPRAPSQFG